MEGSTERRLPLKEKEENEIGGNNDDPGSTPGPVSDGRSRSETELRLGMFRPDFVVFASDSFLL